MTSGWFSRDFPFGMIAIPYEPKRMTWLVGNDLVGWFRYYNLHYPLYPASSSRDLD